LRFNFFDVSKGGYKLITLVSKDIEEYSVEHTTKLSKHLNELIDITKETRDDYGMICGPIEGTFLHFLVMISKAKRILEIGTFTGFSAQMMASALPDDGELITCDIEESTSAVAKEFFVKTKLDKKITQKIGPALETLKSLQGKFDIVFIDADKENYVQYYKRAMELLSEGGLIIIDNVLWGGKVLNPIEETDKAISELNELIKNDNKVKQVVLPVRDGMTLVMKSA
tara:strand:+ start:16776 stop:17456 length:681 start_codon:yes stop_codon:yes gene_type:complete